MFSNIATQCLSEYPPELVSFAASEAERDAEDVIAFLAAVGLAPPPGENRGLPPGILLDLGAVVRLRRWEASSINIHLQADLPSAHVALDNVINTLIAASQSREALAQSGSLARAVFELTITRFAWEAPALLDADIVLDPNNEDVLIEAMAQFLMTHQGDFPPLH